MKLHSLKKLRVSYEVTFFVYVYVCVCMCECMYVFMQHSLRPLRMSYQEGLRVSYVVSFFVCIHSKAFPRQKCISAAKTNVLACSVDVCVHTCMYVSEIVHQLNSI